MARKHPLAGRVVGRSKCSFKANDIEEGCGAVTNIVVANKSSGDLYSTCPECNTKQFLGQACSMDWHEKQAENKKAPIEEKTAKTSIEEKLEINTDKKGTSDDFWG